MLQSNGSFRVFLLCFFLLFQASGISAGERVILGNEVFLASLKEDVREIRFGLVVNHTSLLPDGRPLVQAFLDAGLIVQAVFSPEHGYAGKALAGKIIDDSQLGNIKIYSLYGKNRKPTQTQIQSIDVFVYDIQDIGTRYYTYISTLKLILEAAAEGGKSIYVLDRPNPLGGIIVEGPILVEEFESFIGCCPVPVRYGLTVGELALLMKGEGWVPEDVDLHVIQMKNWQRSHFWEDTGLPWTPTSPNIPSPAAALAYPGTGLLGGIILNQGLGTPFQFLQIGAPWLDSKALIRSLDQGKAYGIELKAVRYIPDIIPGKSEEPPYRGKICEGLRIRIKNKDGFKAVHFTLDLIRAVKEQHPDKLYSGSRFLSQMFGNDELLDYIKGKISYESLLANIKKDEEEFLAKRRGYLLY